MKNDKEKKKTVTGKYVFNKPTGKVVKVSDKASAEKKNGTESPPSCGACGGCCG